MKTVTIKQIQEVIDPRARWIAQDTDGRVCWFGNKPFKDGGVYRASLNSLDEAGTLGFIKVAEFEGKDWTECCVELEPDYNEWVGKLCAFWGLDENNKIIGEFLDCITINGDEKVFTMRGGDGCYYHCRPVKSEEVEFVK